ncbi:MAG: putative replicase [Cressdnaviricota sp.]|nr:MAG: putative replicase [Cressdnaviricota sp.]
MEIQQTIYLRHFKCAYDQLLNWNDICAILFGCNKYLVVEEKVTKNPHFHVQGYTNFTDAYFRKQVQKYVTQPHYLGQKGKQPVRHAKSTEQREIDEKGFQYMLKEPWDNVVCDQGFDSQELVDLKHAAHEHWHKCKYSWKEAMDKVPDTYPDIPKMFQTLCYATMEHYSSIDKDMPNNVRNRVYNYMSRRDLRYRPYVYDKVFKG